MQLTGASLTLAMAVIGLNLSAADPVPYRTTFRVMTYNIHHGEGMDGAVDLERIARVIQDEKVELVALQEVDRGTERTDRIDMPARLTELTGLTCVFSNNYAFDGGEYGNAILSRYPIRGWTNVHLAKLSSVEQRGLLVAVVDVEGTPIRVACTHLDASREDAERLHQVRQLRGFLASGEPLLLAGDFNATPQSAVHRQLMENWIDLWPLVGDGTGHTVPSPNPTRRIDYVWIEPNSSLRPLRAWVPRSLASDHLPLVVEFKLL